MKPIQRIVIGAEIFRQSFPSNRSIEHPAQRQPIHNVAPNANPHNPTRELVHHEQKPMRSQGSGLASKQIQAPQTVLHVAEKSEQDGPPESGSGR